VRVLYIDIDSLRPDHLGCYGYLRPTSPVIDEVAAQGVRFDNFFASDTPCVPSRAALLSARPGIHNGVVAHENTPVGSALRYGLRERYGAAPLLTHHLAAAGFYTASISSFADRHLAGWFHLGFREFRLPSLKGGNEDAPEVNATALPWLERHASKDRWFLHLNNWDPHTLYTEPATYFRKMARYPAPAWPDAETLQAQGALTGIRTLRTLWGSGRHEGFGRSRVPTMPDRIAHRRDFEHLVSGYDGAICYLDEQLGAVLGVLERQGVFDETAILISADHGEAFGELGQYMEHGAAIPAVHRVPLIIRWPGLTDRAAGSVRRELLLNTDLAPTLCEALGLPVPQGWLGASFLPLLRGGHLKRLRREVVLTHGLHTRQRALFDGRFLYLRTYHPSYYLYEPRLLFDLARDPHLTQDLSCTEPERLAAMDARLRAWERQQVAASGRSDPLRDLQPYPPAGDMAAYLERLRRKGRRGDALRLEVQAARLESDYAPDDLNA
jgi:arylsulfatase A-like enzyme